MLYKHVWRILPFHFPLKRLLFELRQHSEQLKMSEMNRISLFFITFSVKDLPSNPKYVTVLPFNMNLSFEILLIQYCNETKFRLILRVR